MSGKTARKFSNPWKLFSAALILCAGVAHAAPEFALLGTNGVEIVSGDAASAGNGTDFGVLAYNTAVTNVFSITNSGDAVLLISGYQIKGYNSVSFSLANLPASVDAGTASNFSIAFSPSNWAPFEARIEISNNSTNTPFVLKLKGDSDKTPFLSTSSVAVAFGTSYLFTVSGFDPLDRRIGIFWSNVPPWAALVSTGGLYHVEVIAGFTNAGFSGDGGPAVGARLNYPQDAMADSKGNVFIADTGNYRIRMVDTNRYIWTVAGGGTNWQNGVVGTNAILHPQGLAIGPDKNVYIASVTCVNMLDTNGILWVVAGHPTNTGFSGDGGPATNALCSFIKDVAVASDGTFYFVENYLGTDGRIRKVDTNGIISTVLWAYNLGSCYSIAVDRDDRLYYAAYGDPGAVYRVDATGGTVRVAGGYFAYPGYPTWATNGWLVNTYGLGFDRRNDMYIGEPSGGFAGALYVVYTNGIMDEVFFGTPGMAIRGVSCDPYLDRVLLSLAYTNKVVSHTYQQRGFVLSGTPTNFVGTTNFLVTITNEYTNITISFTLTVYPALSFGSPSVFEGDSGTTQLVVTAQLNALATSAVTFAFATSNGTAQAGVDYVATNGTVTIPYGTNRATFAITVLGDTIQEPNESINLNISNVSGALVATNLVQAWILNDDTPSLSINDVTQYEGNSGLSNFVFTVSINKSVTNFVSFTFTNVNFSALAGSDYIATGGARTISAGQTSVTIVAQVVGDTNLEPDEVFYVQLRDIQNAIPQKTNGTATILDDDQPRLHINTITNFEGNSGTSNFTFTVTKSYNDGYATLFYFTTSNGTATAGSDYIATNGSGFLLAGQLTTTIVVRVNGDTNVEPDEFFYVIITNASGALPGSNGVGWIRNDDFPSISVNNIAYEEGHSGASNFVFTMTLSEPAIATGSFTFITANGTAASPTDYTATSGVINISVGQTSATAVVRVNGDRTIEPDETFFLQLRNLVNLQPGNTNGQGTILNDDYWPQISVSGVQGYEGNSGTSNFNFRVWLDVVYTGTVQFGFTTVDGTATAAGGDYQATNGTAVIPPGTNEVFVTVLVNGDTELESQEFFRLQIGNFVEAFPVTTNATGTILPDDGPFISATPTSVYEGNSGTTIMQIPIVLSQVSTGAVTFDYYTVNGSASAPADYYSTNAAATIPAGSLSVTVTVTVVGDTTIENDETFILGISNVVGAVVESVSSWAMTIVNDDGNQVFITGTSQYEGNSGTSNFTFVISRTNTTSGAVFSYRSADGTAKAGSDYTAVNSAVFMNPGVSAATVTVQVIGDLIYEGDETFYIQLMNLSGSGSWCANTNALMTILEDGDTLYFDVVTANYTTTLASATVSGTQTGLVGQLTWTNTVTGGTGTQNVSDPWTIAGIGLAMGANPIMVSGTNGTGVKLADTVTVTRVTEPGVTLTVISPYGIPTPSGVTTNSSGSILTNRVTTPDTRGTTQFVCAGWTMSGNAPLSGTTNEFTMTATNSAVLEWLWTTNFYLDLSPFGGGTIGGAASGWYPYGGSVVVTAMPNPGWVFDAWTGDTQGDPNNPVMTLTINGPIGLTAHFEALAEVPPVLGPVNDHIGYVSNLLTFDVNAYDDGGPSNNVTLSVTGLPASATFNVVGNLTNKTGTFSWTPPTNGVWPVMFTANDGLHWTSVLIRIYVTTSGATIVTNIVGRPVPEDEPHWGPEITNATPGNTNVVVDWKAEPGIPYAILISPDYYFLGTAGTSLWWDLHQVITATVDSLSAEIPFPADEDILYFQIVLAIQNDAEQMYAIVRVPIAQGLTMIAPPVVMDLSLTGAFGRALSGVLTGSATEPGAQAELSVWTNGPGGGGWRIFWLRDGVGWCETGQTTPTDFAVEPGKGVFVKNLQAPTNVVFVGEVGQWLWRTNRFFESYNLVTLSDGQFKNLQEQFVNPSSGSVKGSSDFLNADLIYIMHYDMTWSVYQYVTGTGTPKDNKWMDVKTGQVIENPLLRPGMAYYYLRRAGQGILDMPF